MLDISKTCRTCMKISVKLIDIYEPLYVGESPSLQLAEALMEFTSTQITESDGLPQRLCEDCISTLRSSYSFRQLALQTDVKLRNLIFMEVTAIKNEDSFKIEYVDDAVDNTSDEFKVDSAEEVKQEDADIFLCEICSLSFPTQKKLTKHIKSHSTKSLNCIECGKLFRKQSSLDLHMKLHNQSMTVPCSICNIELPDTAALVEHMLEHSEDMLEVKTEYDEEERDGCLYKCDICDKTFKKLRSLASHKKKHKIDDDTFVGELECDVCHSKFSDKPQLRRHLRLHTKPFKCTKCEKTFSRSDQYRDHMKRHDGTKNNICPYCNKAFIQLCNLKDHIRTHTGETPYLCPECGRGFNNSSNLRQHQRRHTGVKPFTCRLCPKSFCTKGQMTNHMATHTGAHPHKCAQCGACFTKPQSLKKHTMIHLGLKPHQCDVCPMRFTDRNHLKRHQRIHTGEKPYQCQVCLRAFAQSNDLVKHLRTHLGNNIYRCSVCNMSFRLQKELKNHYPTHYTEGTEPLAQFLPDFNIPIATDTSSNIEMSCLDVDKENGTDATITITFNADSTDKATDLGNSYMIDVLPGKS